MNTQPLISIIIPNYNRTQLLKYTLDSISQQTSSHWECIIVDDGSTDNSESIISQFTSGDNRFNYYKRDSSKKGASVCRNIGAKKAKGNFLVFLDSDDIITEKFIDARIKEIEIHSDKDMIIFPSAFFYNQIKDSEKLWNIIHKKNITDLERFLNQDTPWHTTGPIWKKESFFKIGGFDEDAQSAQDWEIHVKALLLKLSYHKTKDSIKNIHHYIRLHNNSISKQHNSKERITNRIKTFEKITTLFVKQNQHKTSLKNNPIKHYYRVSMRAVESSLNSEARQNLIVLFTCGVIDRFLLYILILKLFLNDKYNYINKGVDFLIFKFYNLSNIEYPYQRTKGKIHINNMTNNNL